MRQPSRAVSLLVSATAFVLLGAAAPPRPADTTANDAVDIRARHMVDVVRGVVRENVLVRTRGGRIFAVDTASAPSTPGARVVDVGEWTLVPGLIDCHVHLTLAGDPDSNALATLRAGFTTVLDLGALNNANIALKKRIDSGATMGPRMFCAGAWRGAAGGTCDFGGIGVRGVEAFRARVREDIEAGADFIKVCVDGWPSLAYERPDSFEIRADEFEAAIDEARLANHSRVIVHATSREGVRLAVKAGAYAIAHANFADSVTLEEMRSRKVSVIPTLASILAQGRDTPWGKALSENMRRELASGVPVAFGTDAGVLPHGMNAREFRALVRHGLTPIEALRTATLGGAELLGWIRRRDAIGRIERGYIADLIAVEGNPLDSVQVLERVRFVMKRGVVVRNDR